MLSSRGVPSFQSFSNPKRAFVNDARIEWYMKVKFSWNDLFYLFLFHSYQLLASVARKKNNDISFRERSPNNHTKFQTKMFKI